MDAKTFPCRSCGAKLEFAPGQALKCPYCGAENEIQTSGEEIRELDFHAYLSQAADRAEVVENQTTQCPSCGAQQTLEPYVTISHCAFCGSQLQAQAETHRLIKPASLLPFKVKKEEGRSKFRNWISGLWFAPSALKRYAQMDSALKGMYIPYWTYDSGAYTTYRGERGDDYTVTETVQEKDASGNMVTREQQVVKTRWQPASGFVSNEFDDILVLASKSLPRDKTERLEPWDIGSLVPYQSEYLAGFQSEAYQVDLAQGFDIAREKMEPTIMDTIRRDIGGDHQRIHDTHTDYRNITFRHILLPVWISAYRFGAKTFRLVINGRTGEVQGERPYSAAKIALTVAGAVIVAGLIWYFSR